MSETTLAHSVRAGELEGFETWTLDSAEADLHATFAPKAGMLGCSLRHGDDELLHLGGGIREYVRTGAVIGIPLLHPWANRLEDLGYAVDGRAVVLDPDSPLIRLDPNGLPIHGVLAGSPHWEVRAASANGGGAHLSAELDFGAHDDLLAAFPFPHRLRIDVKLRGADLAIRTTVVPTGEQAVPISFGYHPYLRLPGTARERWEIELPVRRRLVLDERMIPTGATEAVSPPRGPLGDRGFDDAYTDLVHGGSFVAAAGGRSLSVSFLENYPFAQVYSPPGAEFICFEPMTAPTNALRRGGASLPRATPPERFAATFKVSVTPV